jgi:hypothetical protein
LPEEPFAAFFEELGVGFGLGLGFVWGCRADDRRRELRQLNGFIWGSGYRSLVGFVWGSDLGFGCGGLGFVW